VRFAASRLSINADVMLLTGSSILYQTRNPAKHGAYPQAMRLFEALANTFFRTFGITEPTQQTRRHAAWFLLGMFTLLAIGFFTAGAILFHIL
jgi:hypothetical protein